MANPSREQMQRWADNYVALWNAGDKEAWIRNWKSIAPGDVRMLDPVGAPEKHGFEHCCVNAFDLFQPKVKFKIHANAIFFCGNEVAWVLENHITADGATTIGLSIETYRFEPDGSAVIRAYYKVPKRTEDELGGLFKDYLPEDGSEPYARMTRRRSS